MRTQTQFSPHCRYCPNCGSNHTEQVNFISPRRTVHTCSNCGKTYSADKGLFIQSGQPPIELYRLTWCYVTGERTAEDRDMEYRERLTATAPHSEDWTDSRPGDFMENDFK